MAFSITYSDDSDLNLYANLYKASDLSYAWNYNNNQFELFSLDNQTEFVIPLEEDSERLGFYFYDFSYDIDAVESDKYYLIEIKKKIGSNYDRENDEIVGSSPFFWNGSEETFPFANTLKIENPISAEDVWNYPTREITNNITVDEIWDASKRTLTENPCSDLNEDLKNIQETIDDIYKTINDNSEKINEQINAIYISLQKIQEQIKPSAINLNTKQPVIGNSGTFSNNTNIKIK